MSEIYTKKRSSLREKLTSKKGVRVLVVVLAIALLAATIVSALIRFDVFNRSPGEVYRTTVCTEAMIGQASGYIDDGDLHQLSQAATQIKDLDEYEYDQNCLYILTRAAMMASNPSELRTQLERLETVYEPPYSNAFTTLTMSPEEIEEIGVVLEQQRDDDLQQAEEDEEYRRGLDQGAYEEYEG